jgi:hypothetical protein
MKFNVISIEHLNWPFSSDGKPSFYIQDGTYKRSEIVDPFPGYAHSAETVVGLTDLINDRIKLDGLTDIYLPAYETPERVNGWARRVGITTSNEGCNYGAYIVLSREAYPAPPGHDSVSDRARVWPCGPVLDRA